MIITLQRRLHEAGRIRLGEKVPMKDRNGKDTTRPGKLDAFRFTSQSQGAINAIAGLYGGVPQPWEDAPSGKQWEVYTDSSEIACHVLPAAMSFTQFYELWSGGGCVRRCDGECQMPNEQPCVCDPDNRECKPTTRLSVLLDDVPGTGQFRLETHGYYAATELSGSFELMERIAEATGQAILPATIRIDHREVKRPGEAPKQFPVPVLDFKINLQALGRGAATKQLPAGGYVTPVPSEPGPSLREQIEAVAAPRPPRANAATPLPATGRRPRNAAQVRTAPEASDDPATMDLRAVTAALEALKLPVTGNLAQKRLRLAEARAGVAPANVASNGSEMITEKQIGLVNILFDEKGFPPDPAERHRYEGFIVGRTVESIHQLTKKEGHDLIEALKAEEVREAEQPSLAYADGEEPF